MLTSIKEIYELMDNGEYNNNKINKFNHIFILTSFFYKAFIEVYQKGEFEKNPSLKEMDIILKYLNKDSNINLNKVNTSEYLLFILGQLHEELLSYPDNIPRQEKLISLENNFGEINTSKSQFYYYYNQTYSKTIIANLFNWIRKAKRTCNICNQSSYSFQAYPLIVFDLDNIVNYMNQHGKQINLDLKYLFIINSMIKYNNTNDTCPLCKQVGGSNINYSLQTSPQYFIIVINRNKPIGLSYKEEFELPIDGNSDIYYTKYKLIGVIVSEENQFSCVMKNSEYEREGKIIENWIEFNDEKVSDIIIEHGKNNSEEEKKIYRPLKAKVLIYKGLNN
jgi:ubiquitin C-terminal hydrolase